MNVSSSGKRKPPRPLSEDSDSDGVSPKVAAKDYAATKISCIATSESEHRELTVVLAGRTRPMKHWHPTTVNNAIRAIIGDYSKAKLLPSGDLAVTCHKQAQVELLLGRDSISHASTTIPVKTSMYNVKPYGSIEPSSMVYHSK